MWHCQHRFHVWTAFESFVYLLRLSHRVEDCVIYYSFVLLTEEKNLGVLGKYVSQLLEAGLCICQLKIVCVYVWLKCFPENYCKIFAFVFDFMQKAAQPVPFLLKCLIKCQGVIILSFFISVLDLLSRPVSPR